MSFNRGTKRNSFGNRNYGRSSGNIGSGGVGMGNVGGGGGGSRGVNPWESGVMPGRGILPTPSNNLSLNSPQAQLVIASNLLSNLLRTQQDSQPQVPSLLSLGNNMNGPASNYRSSQSFSGRFSDRQIRGSVKNQRSQPYSKMGNRARDAVAGRRGPSSAQQSRAQSGNQRINGNQKEHRNDKTSKANVASKQNQTSKKEHQDSKTSDNEKADTQPNAKSDKNDKAQDSEEKKDGDGTPMETNENEEKESGDADKEQDGATKSASSPSKKDDHQSSGKKSEARHAESRYAAVPISQMFCHVCNKHMWDGFSFENHLRGRAHQLMMDKLDESYKLRVDFMRHELKVAEEQRELSLHNSKRRGKKVSVDLSVREYCTMCDLNFYGTLSSHRKSDKHQQLKVFLHPRCGPCSKEFPSRIEYDEHCLTPSHMVHAVQTEEQKKNKKTKLPKGESEIRSAEDEEKDSGPDSKANDINEKDDELPENTEYLMDIVEDMDMTKYKIPSFRYCRNNQVELGASLVKEVQGFHCEKCRRFMATADDMSIHLRTITHYKNFVAEVKALTTPATETNADKSKEESDAQDEPKNEDDEGVENKRRKLDDSVADNSDVSMKEEPKENEQDDSTASKKGDEKYDPLEADGESEEEEQQVEEDEKDKDDSKHDQSIEGWGDGDNDNEPEVGNLLGDDDEDEPESSTPITPLTPSTPSQNKQPSQQPLPKEPQQSPQKTQPSTPQQTSAPPATDNKKDTPNLNSNSSQAKSPRGGGQAANRGFRGRGHQRARRSRR